MGTRFVDSVVQSLLTEARLLPECQARISLLERAATRAETLSDLDTAWTARCEILESSVTFDSQCFETLFLCLAWCLSVADKDPFRFRAQRILWQYKWVVTAAPKYATVPRAVVERLVEDMDQRFIREGWGRRAGAHKRIEVLQLLGQAENARERIKEWHATPRDRGSDCHACEVDAMVDLLVDLGDFDAALREAKPIISGKLQCATVPHRTFGTLLLAGVKLGKLPLAKELYDRGRRLIASKGEQCTELTASYFLFACFSRNVDHAIAITRARLARAHAMRPDWDRMRWFGQASVGFDLLARQGVSDVEVPVIHGFIEKPVVLARNLADSCRTIAQEHADKLNSRNANNFCSNWLENLTVYLERFPSID